MEKVAVTLKLLKKKKVQLPEHSMVNLCVKFIKASLQDPDNMLIYSPKTICFHGNHTEISKYQLDVIWLISGGARMDQIWSRQPTTFQTCLKKTKGQHN